MISFVAVCRYKSNCFEYYWMLGRKSMKCRWNRNRMYVHSFPGWWPSIDLSVNLLKSLILGPDFDTMRNDSPFRSACYKWLQSRFITENILQFNSIKLFHLGFMLCCQFIRIIWLGTFVSIGAALQYSDHETETILNRNLFDILCVRLPWQKTWQGSSNTKVEHSSSSSSNKRAQQYTHKFVYAQTQPHKMSWTEQQIQVLMPMAQRILVKPARSWFWEITFGHLKFGNDFSAFCGGCFSSFTFGHVSSRFIAFSTQCI